MRSEATITKISEQFSGEVPLQVGPPLFDVGIDPAANPNVTNAGIVLETVVIFLFLAFLAFVIFKAGQINWRHR